MIGPSAFHLQGKSQAHGTLRGLYEQYHKLDNAAGDRQQAEDRVELSNGKASTQVILQPGFFSKGFIERVQDEAGGVTFREYEVPCFSPFSNATGNQVSKNPQGQYSGETLSFFNSGYGNPFYSSDPMAKSQSAQQFNLLEARFQAEFPQG